MNGLDAVVRWGSRCVGVGGDVIRCGRMSGGGWRRARRRRHFLGCYLSGGWRFTIQFRGLGKELAGSIIVKQLNFNLIIFPFLRCFTVQGPMQSTQTVCQGIYSAFWEELLHICV